MTQLVIAGAAVVVVLILGAFLILGKRREEAEREGFRRAAVDRVLGGNSLGGHGLTVKSLKERGRE